MQGINPPTIFKSSSSAKSSLSGSRLEIVTCDTANLKETAFGSIATSKTIFEIIRSRFPSARYNEINTESDLEAIAARKPDLVVLCVKYLQSVDQASKIWLSDYFAKRGITHTGSGRAALEFDSNKSKAKIAIQSANLPTAKFFLAYPGSVECEAQLPFPFPLFIKPLDAANGNGIDAESIVRDFTSYQRKVSQIEAAFHSAVLVEEVLTGREFTVAILDDKTQNIRHLSPVEIVIPRNKNGDRILGAAEKVSNGERLIKVSGPTYTEVSELASTVFSILGAQDIGRIDIKLDALGVPHFMEANLLPGLTPVTSYFPRAFKIDRSIPYDILIQDFIGMALRRSRKEKREFS